MKKGMSLLLVAALMASGCGDGSGEDGPDRRRADVMLLTMGNSHAQFNNLQGMLEEMVGSAHPGESVAAVAAPGWMFLDERISHEPSLTLIRRQDWNYVVLQAQRYFLVTRPQPPTIAAETFVRMAREQHAVPILFPEWPRLGIDETMIIYDLLVSVAQKEPACVAPVGQAWELSLSRHPGIRLHDLDGNHSNANGAFLAALMLFATITGHSPLDVPHQDGFEVAADTQALLRQVAADTVVDWPARQWCPNDPT